MIEPLPVREGLVIPSECLSVSYTRTLVAIEEDGERRVLDGVEAARRQPSAVELRMDVKACTVLDDAEKRKVLAYRPLRADRRGVVRATCATYESRPKNLGGAREALSYAIRAALEAPDASEPEVKPKRGRGGLIKSR